MHIIGFNTKRICALICAAIVLLINFEVVAQSTADVSSKHQVVQVPMKGAGLSGRTLDLHTEIFKPEGDGPFPVLIYAHGRSGTQQERSSMSEVIPREYLRFWISRGFAVVAPARPGYGKTGGIDREIPGHSWSAVGACQGKPNPEQVANAAGAALLATMTWIREQPWIDNSKMILSGNSVGGLAIVSLGSTALSGVVGYVNFAGGVAGNPVLSPKRSCAPETVRDAYEKYGKSTRVPNLWIYAENDLFWGAEVPKEWHAAFAAGGSKTKLVTTAALPAQDGHELIFVGRSVWSPYVEDFLKQIGFN